MIENRLEATGHNQLGQMIVHASGLDAAVVIWVSPRFPEEFRRALDWLNDRTDAKVDFFGVEIGLVRIGRSLPAPGARRGGPARAAGGSQGRRVPALPVSAPRRRLPCFHHLTLRATRPPPRAPLPTAAAPFHMPPPAGAAARPLPASAPPPPPASPLASESTSAVRSHPRSRPSKDRRLRQRRGAASLLRDHVRVGRPPPAEASGSPSSATRTGSASPPARSVFMTLPLPPTARSRAGVYLDMQERTATKRLFDDLYAERLGIETAVGRILSNT